MTSWNPGVVHLRHFDKEKKSYAAEHICWNIDLFQAAAQKAAVEAGGHVERITEKEYREAHKK